MKVNGKKRHAARALAVMVGATLCASVPGLAFATSGSSSLLDDVAGLFSNLGTLGLVIYEGIIGIAAIITFIQIGKELIPALLQTNRSEAADFKGHVTAAIVAAIVLLALALAPIYVPALLSYFGATADVGMSAITGI